MQAAVALAGGRVAQDVGFDELYSSAYARLVRQVYAFTGDLGEAQDCVQEAFARAFLRWAHVSGLSDPEAWVRTVAFRLSISRWRKARNALVAWRRRGLDAAAPDLSPDHVALVTALRAIPVAQREAIVLHHLCGLSVEEIAAQAGTPTGTIKARLFRGRASLASLLAPEAPEVSRG
jgi:RNA polymerase sigma-70 factor, ECF subfamily